MDKEELIKIFNETDFADSWEGDNAFQGLQIIAKYIDIKKEDIITGADHDIMYSVDIDKIIKLGLTIEDVKKLNRLNWILEEDEYLACFV